MKNAKTRFIIKKPPQSQKTLFPISSTAVGGRGWWTAGKSVLLIASTCLITGCGGSGLPTYPVKGEVVYSDGSPVTCGGRITFTNSNATTPITGKGYLGDDGKFTLTLFDRGKGFVEGIGLEAGDYAVAIFPNVPDDRGTLSEAEYNKALNPIDDRYKRPSTSELWFKVTDDSEANNFRVEVSRPGRSG